MHAVCSVSVRRRQIQAAFSLVELVIVVVIIGIIAAIAVPRFSRAIASSREAYISSTLRTVQSAMQHYHAEHGRYPGYNPSSGTPNGDWFVKQLLQYSSASGQTSATFGDPYIYGSYLRPPFPANPLNQKSTVKVLSSRGDSVTAGSTGWVAVLSDGDFRINSEDADLVGLALDVQKVGVESLRR